MRKLPVLIPRPGKKPRHSYENLPGEGDPPQTRPKSEDPVSPEIPRSAALANVIIASLNRPNRANDDGTKDNCVKFAGIRSLKVTRVESTKIRRLTRSQISASVLSSRAFAAISRESHLGRFLEIVSSHRGVSGRNEQTDRETGRCSILQPYRSIFAGGENLSSR